MGKAPRESRSEVPIEEIEYPMNLQDELEQKITERFAELPPAVRDAILSADVPKNLRTLSDAHQLHLDQWQLFENEVMLAILGFQRVEDLERNITTHVKVAPEMARQLATDVNVIIFEPIREQLERTLEHPGTTPIEGSEIASTQATIPAAPVVQPATPPAPAPDIKVARPSSDSAYRPGEASHERKSIADDPYRESIA